MEFVKGTRIKAFSSGPEDEGFGVMIWEVVETGLMPPEIEKQAAGVRDGVKLVMRGGSGPLSRNGYVVIESQESLNLKLAAKQLQIIRG